MIRDHELCVCLPVSGLLFPGDALWYGVVRGAGVGPYCAPSHGVGSDGWNAGLASKHSAALCGIAAAFRLGGGSEWGRVHPDIPGYGVKVAPPVMAQLTLRPRRNAGGIGGSRDFVHDPIPSSE